MRVPRLFTAQALAANNRIKLEGDRVHYLRNVLRCRVGDALTLFNGEGGAFPATIEGIDRHEVRVTLGPRDDGAPESTLCLRLGLAISKRQAMDFALQKCTELGVSEITPVLTRYSDVAAKASDSRQDHWQEVIHSACEQCERNVPPRLGEIQTLDDWVAKQSEGTRLVAHPGRQRLGDLVGITTPVALLIGPEGGLTEAEFDTATASGFEGVSLGPRILRVETAAVALAAILQARWGDMG